MHNWPPTPWRSIREVGPTTTTPPARICGWKIAFGFSPFASPLPLGFVRCGSSVSGFPDTDYPFRNCPTRVSRFIISRNCCFFSNTYLPTRILRYGIPRYLISLFSFCFTDTVLFHLCCSMSLWVVDKSIKIEPWGAKGRNEVPARYPSQHF